MPTSNEQVNYGFVKDTTMSIKSGHARAIILYGNTHDLFYLDSELPKFVSLKELLKEKYDHRFEICGKEVSLLFISLDLTGGIKIDPKDYSTIRTMYVDWRMTTSKKNREFYIKEFDDAVVVSSNDSVAALQLLKFLTIASRTVDNEHNLFIMVDSADFHIPNDEMSRLQFPDRKRIAIVENWFSDFSFLNGGDTVILVCDSPSGISERITKLPQITSIEVPLPDYNERRRYIEHFYKSQNKESKNSLDEIATKTAALKLHAIRQMLVQHCYHDVNESIENHTITETVKGFIKNELGDKIDYLKLSTRLDDVIGFRKEKQFARNYLIPSFETDRDSKIAAMIVPGPVGGGKTFFFSALAGELDCPVIILKNMRSQWYGQTDVNIEKLKRILLRLDRAVVLIDEADAQLGSISQDTHATDARLNAQFLAMMSDSMFLGKVLWVMITARIWRLNSDLRRYGRGGSLIMPILDMDSEDRKEFCGWLLKEVIDDKDKYFNDYLQQLVVLTKSASPAYYSVVRNEVRGMKIKKFEDLKAVVLDNIEPNIEKERRYQTLHALMNCTRRSLLPEDCQNEDITKLRAQWNKEIKELEFDGVKP